MSIEVKRVVNNPQEIEGLHEWYRSEISRIVSEIDNTRTLSGIFTFSKVFYKNMKEQQENLVTE